MKQVTNTILMVKPVAFRMNEQTAINNYYQKVLDKLTPKTVQNRALKEFNTFVDKLKEVGVQVIVVEDTKDLDTPDSIFPNNWISFHEDKVICMYPMYAENRRFERRMDIVETVEKETKKYKDIIDYTQAENENVFLEGTGSLVLDRQNRIAYCALSPRADESLLIEFCEDLEFTPVVFRANQTVGGKRKPIYHTNVMMCVGVDFSVVCLQTIDDKNQRKNLVKHLEDSGKRIINISEEQVGSFAGNMLQVQGKDKDYIIMSSAAYKSLSKAQIKIIKSHSEILHSSVDTIEACGGGSVRCMMAEVF